MGYASTFAKVCTVSGITMLLAACAGPYYGPGPYHPRPPAPVAAAPCPPGLAKKGSCIPPGHRKQWRRGDVVPDDVRYRVITRYRDYGFRSPPPGHIYIQIDTGIYLMARASRRIVEVYVSGR